MSFRAINHTMGYTARPGRDAEAALYHARLMACEACIARFAHECQPANQLCSIVARPIAGKCPHSRWPGEIGAAPPPTPAKIPHSALRTPHSPLRVGLFTDVFAMGGVERWWLSLCRQWSAGTKITPAGVALTDRGPVYLPIVAEAQRFAPLYCSKSRQIPGARALEVDAEACRALAARCDVILSWCHSDLKPLLGDFSGPVVQISHGEGEWTRRIVGDAYVAATHFAAVSNAAVNAFPPAIRPKVRVIENGVDLDRCTPALPRAQVREAWGLAPDQIAVGYCGRYSPEKNPLAAADAVAWINANGRARLLPSRSPAIAVYAHPHFVTDSAAGDVYRAAGGRAALIPEEASRGVGYYASNMPAPSIPHSEYHTPYSICVAPDHMGDILAALDVFVLASREEGGSLGLLEALAAGVPCVVTPVGAVDDLESRFGILFTRVPLHPTPAQLGAAVLTAASSTISRQRGREMVFHNFSAARMAREWEAFLLNAECGMRNAEYATSAPTDSALRIPSSALPQAPSLKPQDFP